MAESRRGAEFGHGTAEPEMPQWGNAGTCARIGGGRSAIALRNIKSSGRAP